MFREWLDRRRFDIQGSDGSLYLQRWTLLRLFGWKLNLHRFHRPDEDQCPHDHPWTFFSLVLWGGYVEEIEELVAWHPDWKEERRYLQHNRPSALLYRPAEFRHRIVSLPKGTCWTLVLASPRQRSWGFWTSEGWKPWRQFLTSAKRALWCQEGTHHPQGGSDAD